MTAAEGFGKARLFEIMDDLEEKTRPIMQEARQRLAKDKGEAALEAHNIGYALAGGWLCVCVSSCLVHMHLTVYSGALCCIAGVVAH